MELEMHYSAPKKTEQDVFNISLHTYRRVSLRVYMHFSNTLTPRNLWLTETYYTNDCKSIYS